MEHDHVLGGLARTSTDNCQEDIGIVWARNTTHQPPRDDPGGEIGGQMPSWISEEELHDQYLGMDGPIPT